MKIGFLADLRNPPPWAVPWAQHYGQVLELLEEADRLGASAVFFGEHHFTEDGYLPQPLTFAAATAARTSRMRIGTAVVLASLRHPTHLAEEAAIVDALSGGRLELGLGAGYVPVEFDGFGADRDQRFRLLDHAMIEVRRLLTEVVSPPPVQERLPIWCGYYGKGVRRVGLAGEGLLNMVPSCLEPYLDGLRAGGHDPATARMAGPIDLVVSDDPERTRAILQPHFEWHAGAYGRLQQQAAVVDGPRLGTFSPDTFKVLTPDDAITHIRTVVEGLPVRYLLPWLSVANMPADVALEHVTLTTTKVAPAFD